MMSDVVLDGLFRATGLSHGREFREKCLKGALWCPGEQCMAWRGHLRPDTLHCQAGDSIGEAVVSHVDQQVVAAEEIST